MATLESQLAAMGVKPISPDLQGALGSMGVMPAGETVAPQDTPGFLGTALRGAENSLTLGAGSKINGALEALLDRYRGTGSGNLSADIAQHAAESKALSRAGAEAHPIANIAGNLAGGAALASATGGLGLLPEAATWGQALANGTALGAATGGVQAYNDSDATDAAGTGKDVLAGTVMGGTLGGALGVGGHIAGDAIGNVANELLGRAKGAGETIAGLPTVSRGLDATKMGWNKEITTGQAGLDMVDAKARGLLGQSGDALLPATMQSALSDANNAKMALLSARGTIAPEQYAPWLKGVEDTLQRASDKFTPAPFAPIQDQINNFFKTTPDADGLRYNKPITANDMDMFKQIIGDWGSAKEATGKANPLTQAMVDRILTPWTEAVPRQIDNTLGVTPGSMQPLKTFMNNEMPGYNDINAQLSALQTARNSMPNMSTALSAEKGGIGGIVSNDKVQSFLDALKSNPDTAKLVPQFEGPLTDIGKAADVVGHQNAPGLSHGFIADTARGGVLAAGNTLGRGARMFYDMSPQGLKSAAAKVSGMGIQGASNLASILSEAANRDRIGANALIFAAEQNPLYRSIMHTMANSIPGASPGGDSSDQGQ